MIGEWIKAKLFGWKNESEYGSNFRRALARLGIWFVLLAILQLILSYDQSTGQSSFAFSVFAFIVVVVGLSFFINNVLLTPFRETKDFRVNAPRLMIDTLASSRSMIFAFSFVYRATSLVPEASVLDTLYFSSVTFSTLGYGDFSPVDGAVSKMTAAFEALVGNLHLGMLVGATFVALRPD